MKFICNTYICNICYKIYTIPRLMLKKADYSRRQYFLSTGLDSIRGVFKDTGNAGFTSIRKCYEMILQTRRAFISAVGQAVSHAPQPLHFCGSILG